MPGPGKIKHSRGASLLEAMVAFGVLATIAATTSQFFNQSSTGNRKERLRQTQRMIASSLKNAIKSPSNLYYSVARYDLNPLLASCVLHVPVPGGTAGNCQGAVDKSQPARFALFIITNKEGTQAQQLSTAQAEEHKLLYDINGTACKSSANSECIFEANTYFFASCPGDSPSCPNGAKQIYIKYEVKQKSGSFASLGSELPPFPQVQRYVTMSVSQILGPSRFSECGKGASKLGKLTQVQLANFNNDFTEGFYATLVGYDDYGRPKCDCVYPFKKVGEQVDPTTKLKTPVCRLFNQQELSCGPGSFLRGIEAKGEAGEAICVGQNDAFECESRDSQDKCRDGWWVTKIARNDCKLRCEYRPDKRRSCKFSWRMGGGLTKLHGSFEDPNQLDFNCNKQKLYCCRPKMHY